MSEKHLTELPWKTLVTKQGVKDIGLGKALAAYAKVDATKEPAQALETLKEISEFALKLKRLYSSKQDVVDHLDEVIKEAKKTTPVLEAKVKSASAAAAKGAAKPEEEEEEDEGEEEAEAAEFKKDLKKQMVSALAQVKMRAPGDPEQKKEPKPQLQFMAYLAAKGSAVVVARKVGSATKKLLPDIAGVASGGKFVKGECIFEKNSHTFVLDEIPGGLAKKLAKALFTETGTKYKVRVRSTDGSTELDSDTDVDPEEAAATSTATAPDSAQEMARFTARFKALQPDLVKLIGTKAPQGGEAKQRATEAGALAGKKDFIKANQLLDMVESLIKKGGTTAGGPALPIWQQAKDAVDSQLEGLYSKLKKSGVPVLNEVANEIEGVLGNFRTGLVTALTEYDGAAGPKKEQARAKALQVVTAYQESIPKDKHVIAADTNPFGFKVAVRQTLGSALANLSTRLKAG